MTSLAASSITRKTAVSTEAAAVKHALVLKGLETPMLETGLTRDEKYLRIKAAMRDVVTTLGLDLSDDSLTETPHRIAKMYIDEIFSGLDYSQFPKISVIENKMGVEEMVKITDINLTSTCEHHFVTIDGVADVAYIPNEKIIGSVQNQSYRALLCPKTPSSRALDPANLSGLTNASRHGQRSSSHQSHALLRQIERRHGYKLANRDNRLGWSVQGQPNRSSRIPQLSGLLWKSAADPTRKASRRTFKFAQIGFGLLLYC